MAEVVGRLEPEVIDRYFGEMAEMDVPLDPDPLLFTPTRLANKIAVSRQYLSRVQRIWTELSQRQATLKRQLRKADLAYELQFDHLMAEDTEVLAGPSQGVREAIARRKLKQLIEDSREIQAALEDIEIALKVASSKRTDLKDTQQRIKDQIKLCEEELGLQGRRWGQRGPGSVTGNDVPFKNKRVSLDGRSTVDSPPRPGVEMPELDDLLEEMEGEPPTPEELFPATATDEAVDAFLGEGEEKGKKKDSIDISDIFD